MWFYGLAIEHFTADCNWRVTLGTSPTGFTHLLRYLNALWHLLDLHTAFLSFSPRIAHFAQDRNPSVTPTPALRYRSTSVSRFDALSQLV